MNKIKLLAVTSLLAFVTGCIDNVGSIRYCSVGDYAPDDFTVALNIAVPDGEGPFPTLVFIHGGYWAGGDLTEYSAELTDAKNRGYTAATIDYRLTAEKVDGVSKYPWDAQLEDVKCAIRYLKANAIEHKVDIENIGVAGFSAGGHLALMAGLTTDIPRFEEEGQFQEFSSTVQAVVAFSPPTDLNTLYYSSQPQSTAQRVANDLLGATPDQDPAIYLDVSPTNYTGNSNVPLLLLHGDADTTVPINQSNLLVAGLQSASHPEHPMVVYEGNGHGWAGLIRAHANANMWAFFDKHLKGDNSTPLSCSPYPSCEG